MGDIAGTEFLIERMKPITGEQIPIWQFGKAHPKRWDVAQNMITEAVRSKD